MNITTSSQFDHIHLAFDIHDVLAHVDADKTSGPLFQEYGMVIEVPLENSSKRACNYVYPHVKELFQLLAQTPGVHIGFFTSSIGEFGRPFIKQLLINALGEEKYAQIADKVNVCTRENLKDNENYCEIQHSKYSKHGNKRKDLNDVFPDANIPKKQRILIDDDPSFATPNQTKNLFKISSEDWSQKLRRYHSNGYCIYFCPSEKKLEKIQTKLQSTESIALYTKENEENGYPAFVIIYYDKEGKKEFELSSEESIKIKELYDKLILENTAFFSREYCEGNQEKDIINEIEKTNLEKDSNNNELICIYGPGVNAKNCINQASKEDIAIHLLENGDANIYFPHDPEKAISLNAHGSFELIKLAREYWQAKCNDIDYCFKDKNKKTAHALLYDTIWDKVKDLVYKDKMLPEANHVLLLIGTIFKAWKESKTTQKPISKILFNWQCKSEKGNKTFAPEILKKRTDLYSFGLELLRKVNPNLQPITIKNFEAALEKHS